MTEIEKLEKRWSALLVPKPENLGPVSSDEIEEINLLAKQIEFERVKEYAGLINELQEKDINITSIWDLVNTKKTYREGIDVLINHLDKEYHQRTKEGIVRSLIVKEAIGIATKALMKEYETTPKEKDDFRWIIGCAVGFTMTNKDSDWVIATVLDKSNGGSRSGMLVPLVRIKSEKAESVLLQLLNEENPDGGIVLQAIEGLGKLKSHLAKDKLNTFINHKNKDFAKAAQKALLKIG